MTIHTKQSAFTMIEVIVAVAVVSILATMTVVNLSISRRTARDGTRKADASSVLAAVNQYVSANGTSLIAYPAAGGTSPGTCTITDPTNPDQPAVGASCVGASGRAYGKINLKSATTTGVVGSVTGSRVYPDHSIAEALRAGGYFNVQPADPYNKSSDGSITDPTVRDYVLIRACPNGRQHIGKHGNLYAVWVALEGSVNTTDAENTSHLPGASTAAPDANYVYDFAAGPDQSLYQTNGFAVGNGAATKSVGDAAGSCVTNANG